MWWIVLAIAIPFLFIIGTTYSAIKEQKRLEEGALKDVLSARQKKRLEQYKKKSQNKIKAQEEQQLSSSDAPAAFVTKEVSEVRDPINEDLSDERKKAILKIDALIDSLDNKSDDKALTELKDKKADGTKGLNEGHDKMQDSASDANDEDIYSIDTSATSIQKSLDEALSFVEDDKKL